MDPITPIEIKEWLTKINKDRDWLAKECHVSKTTVDGWLSAGRNIPKPTFAHLKALMGRKTVINPMVTLTTFLRAQEIARSQNLSLDAWIEFIIDKEIQHHERQGAILTEKIEVGGNVPLASLPDPAPAQVSRNSGRTVFGKKA